MVDRFLADLEAAGQEESAWEFGGAPLPLRLRYFLTGRVPPEPRVSSVRAVVLSRGRVLVMRNPGAVHAVPGGRREPGETFEDTVRREVLEEAGCAIRVLRQLGVVHLRHLGPKPPRYPHLYPDFLQVVFLAEAAGAQAAVEDEYELEARFLAVEEALELVDYGSRIFIRAAVDESLHLRA